MRRPVQRQFRMVLAVLLATAAAALPGCGERSPAGLPGTPVAAPPAVARTVELTLRDGLLVDAEGDALYVNDQELGGPPRCVRACLDVWLPVAAPSSGAPSQPVPGLGVLLRSDNGLAQLTYLRQPLYLFRMDDAPGEARGDGLRDTFGGADFVWRAVRVVGPANPTAGVS